MSVSEKDFIEMFKKDKEQIEKEIGEILMLLELFVPPLIKLDGNLTKKDYLYYSLMVSKIKHAYSSLNEAICLFAFIEGKDKE